MESSPVPEQSAAAPEENHVLHEAQETLDLEARRKAAVQALFEKTGGQPYVLHPPRRQPYSPVCIFCIHLDPDLDPKCAAFPEGIPLEIWDGHNKHTESYPGDHGILFERRPPLQH